MIDRGNVGIIRSPVRASILPDLLVVYGAERINRKLVIRRLSRVKLRGRGASPGPPLPAADAGSHGV
jgi:hypothetical protein